MKGWFSGLIGGSVDERVIVYIEARIKACQNKGKVGFIIRQRVTAYLRGYVSRSIITRCN